MWCQFFPRPPPSSVMLPSVFLPATLQTHFLGELKRLENGSKNPFCMVFKDPVFEKRPAGVDNPFIGSAIDLSALMALKITAELENNPEKYPNLARASTSVHVSTKEASKNEPLFLEKPRDPSSFGFLFSSEKPRIFIVTVYPPRGDPELEGEQMLYAMGLSWTLLTRHLLMPKGHTFTVPDAVVFYDTKTLNQCTINDTTDANKREIGSLESGGFTIPDPPTYPPVSGVATPQKISDALFDAFIKISARNPFAAEVTHLPDERCFMVTIQHSLVSEI